MPLSFADYLTTLRGVPVAVFGIGISNTPLLRLLAKAGARITACDRKSRAQLGALADELDALGIDLRLGEETWRSIEARRIYRTPGLRPDHPALRALVDNGALLTSEMEDFLALCPSPVIGVTGSDGKTTTTTLIAHMLTEGGFTVHVGGNIGTPLLDKLPGIRPDHRTVVELSSFQLMTLSQSPSTAIITNITPNHLDVHTSLAEYIQAKENIFRHQSATGRLIVNADCPAAREAARHAPGQVSFFARTQSLTDGYCLADGWLTHRKNGVGHRLVSKDDIALPGAHNIENYLAACAAVDGQVSLRAMQTVAQTFQGVPHRLQYVATRRGVRYYNDSIASSPTRATAGLSCFANPVILIAGGSDKKIPFDALAQPVSTHAKLVILNGDTAPALADALSGTLAPIYQVQTLEEAVALAAQKAQAGDTVLLSPACPSFDQFLNFEDRGRRFMELVAALPE